MPTKTDDKVFFLQEELNPTFGSREKFLHLTSQAEKKLAEAQQIIGVGGNHFYHEILQGTRSLRLVLKVGLRFSPLSEHNAEEIGEILSDALRDIYQLHYGSCEMRHGRLFCKFYTGLLREEAVLADLDEAISQLTQTKSSLKQAFEAIIEDRIRGITVYLKI